MLHSNTTPRYFPHLNKPGLLEMGLAPIERQVWIEPDDALPAYLSHKQLMRQRLGDGVLKAAPQSMEAQLELKGLLQQHLLGSHPDVYQMNGNQLQAKDLNLCWDVSDELPIWQASLWVADDLVIMQPSPEGYRLVAASLCSPSSWLLEEKFTQPMHAIHQPLPDAQNQLGAKVDRFFTQISAGRIFQRFNWSVQVGDDLYWQHSAEPEVSPQSPLSWRVERQTICRLPASGALAFTIRVYIHPLEALARVDGALEALFLALDNYPAAHADYKGFARLTPALEKYRAMQ